MSDSRPMTDRPYRTEVFEAEDGEPGIRLVEVTQAEYTALTTELARYRAVVKAARELEGIWNRSYGIWLPAMNRLAQALAALDADQPTEGANE